MRPLVLAFVDHYLPGYRGGGPTQSLSNLAAALADDYAFHVVTRDHDAGIPETYPGVTPGRWHPVQAARVMYLGERDLNLRGLATHLADADHDLIYFNSLFSLRLTVLPLLLLRLGRIRRSPIIVAPRGELSPGHLRLRPLKYYGSLLLARWLGLFKGVTWHATSDLEAAHIRRWFRHAPIALAPNLSASPDAFPGPEQHPAKQPGRLRAMFLSRIAPKKNLDGAIQALAGLRGDVRFDIWGPIRDPEYWARCQRLIAQLPANVDVRLQGPLPNARVPEVLRDYDLFLLPTHGENHGHAIIEAMLGSCPVLISEHTPWRDLASRHAGWDRPNDPASVGDTLQRIIDMGEDAHRRWREGARRYAETVVHTDAALAQTRALFAGALAARR